jgi:fluoroacetyl-CoA thioesterase
MKETLRPGLTHTLTYVVPEHRTVPHLLPESPDFAALPPVLATGYLLGLSEWACMEALHGHLDDNEITLGVHVDVSHDAPTVPGSTVQVDVTLASVEGRTLTFEVRATDNHAVVSSGTHRRAVVDRVRMADRLDRLRAGGPG